MKRFYWTGVCNDDRTTGISRIEECICPYGFITDFRFFSDLSMSMVIETQERNISSLYENLTKIIAVSNDNEFNSSAVTECTIFFNITFTRGTGHMRVEVPAFPG